MLFYYVVLCLSAGASILSILLTTRYLGAIIRSGSARMLIYVINLASPILLLCCAAQLYMRNPKFLLLYEITICMSVISTLLSSQFVFSNVLISLLGPIIWRMYLQKSLRVKVYMGGDNYLRESLIGKSFPVTTRPRIMKESGITHRQHFLRMVMRKRPRSRQAI